MAKAEGQKCVDTVKERASKIGIKIHTEVILSELSAVKTIVEYAEEQKIDLLVLGRSGMSGIKKMLLGSTASGVVTYAHCPVLVVK
jgi:nucleotide-binding universal stress UspA family protein